jgi:tRNA-binding EMAP/Myf-like protein
MQNRLVVLLCNLKPAKLRGVASEAMVLCASTPEKVELLVPPENAQVGDRVTASGYDGAPEKEINTKNKIFELVQPDLKTNDSLVATYKGIPLEIKSKGAVKTSTLKNVPIK